MKNQTGNEKAPLGKESSLEELRRHRIVRIKRQNEKVGLELKKTKGDLVSLDKFKAEVIAANATVKAQLLALPFQLAPELVNLSDPQEIQRILYTAIVQCLNDLAYERERPAEQAHSGARREVAL